MSRQIIFFEPAIKGHQMDHVEQLCRWYSRQDLPLSVIFVVNYRFFDVIRDRGKTELFSSFMKSGVKFRALSAAETSQCLSSVTNIAAVQKWRLAKKYAGDCHCDHLHFMEFDHLLLPLNFSGFSHISFSISGLVFRPSFHFPDPLPGFSARAKNFIKHKLYIRMLKNRNVTRLFTFDPYFKDYSAENLPHSEKIDYIPDPDLFSRNFAENKKSLTDFSVAGKKMLVMFGYIQQRKGIFQMLESLKKLDRETSSRLVIRIAGEIDPGIRKKVNQHLDELVKKNKYLEIILEDNYISEIQLVSLLYSCDGVLAPYQNFIGSSGVLYWAAGAGKPIITQEYGLLGRLVKDHQLGYTANTADPADIARVISGFVHHAPEYTRTGKQTGNFIKDFTPELFAEKLFSGIINR